MLVVLDANVLVSGLLNPKGPPGKILDLAMDNQIQVAYDDRILGGYEEVLSRPELRFHPWRVKAVIDHLELSDQHVTATPFLATDFSDPDDLMFAEVFLTSDADALVTGNLKHFAPLLDRNLPVLSPARFLETYY